MTARIIPQCLTLMEKLPQLLMNFDINDTDLRLSSLRNGTRQFAILEPENSPREMETKKTYFGRTKKLRLILK